MIWYILSALVLLLVVLVGVTLILRGRDLSHLDGAPITPTEQDPSPSHREVLKKIREMNRAGRHLRGRARLQAMREFMDGMSDGLELVSEFRPASGTAEPDGEWVIAPGADPDRRILYVHGGAWVAGSAQSHRAITDRLSQLTSACVFAVNYRLMPEHRFRDGIRDCQSGYRWMLDHGPNGAAPADFVAVAGDSAGGSHTLSLVAWVRDQGLRQPDAAVALSPSTDLTFTAPSLKQNVRTDPLLGPGFRSLTRVPQPLLWWATFVLFRISPAHPMASPLRGNLSGLPPILIHASDSEMLLDDSRRYVTRAQQAGSPVELRIWPGMLHVWHIFAPWLPEAEEALQDIGDFLNRAGQKETR